MKLKLTALLFLMIPFLSWGQSPKRKPNQTLIELKEDYSYKLANNVAATVRSVDSDLVLLKFSEFDSRVQGLFKGSKAELPMLVEADFDGDKTKDIAVLAKKVMSKKKVVVKAILLLTRRLQNSKVVSYRPYVVDEWEFDLTPVKKKYSLELPKMDKYLSLRSQKDANLGFRDGKVKPRDILQIEILYGDTKAYYFQRKDDPAKSEEELLTELESTPTHIPGEGLREYLGQFEKQ